MSDEAAIHNAQKAFDQAADAGVAVHELQRTVALVAAELGYLKTFNGRLLGVLKHQFKMDDAGLGALMRHVDQAALRATEQPGQGLAPPCPSCSRPLQEDSEACIYCGRLVPLDKR